MSADVTPDATAWIGAETPLPHVVTLPVLGIATRFLANDRAALDHVEASFGVWRALGDADVAGADDPVEVRILVGGERAAADDGASPIRHAMDEDLRFVARSAASVAVGDPARRAASIRVTASLADAGLRFRAEMLESVVLALLSCYDRHPVHAAAVARDGHALLLAAPSGTGKSTLAYHCHLAGIDLLGDDHVRVQLAPSLRVWGWPARVRLLSDVAERLGAANEPLSAVNGKRKAVVDARSGVGADRLVAHGATVCLLTRDGGALAYAPLPAAEVARALDAQLVAGFDRFPSRWPAVRDALASRGGWRLNLSSDPHEAVAAIRELLASAR